MRMVHYFLCKNDYCGVYTVEYYALLYGTSQLRAITPATKTIIYILKNQQEHRSTHKVENRRFFM